MYSNQCVKTEEIDPDIFQKANRSPLLPPPSSFETNDRYIHLRDSARTKDRFECTAKAKHCFHILFFTSIDINERSSFVAMDIIQGNLYHISYEADTLDSSTGGVCISELLSQTKFLQLLETYEAKIPGVTEAFSNYFNEDWKKYLTITQKQVLDIYHLMISFDSGGQRHFLFFENEKKLHSFSCSQAVYSQWKTRRNYVLDDILFLDELISASNNYCKKRVGIFLGRKYQNCINQLHPLCEKATSAQGNMDIIFIKNGLVQYAKSGVDNPVIADNVFQLQQLMNR